MAISDAAKAHAEMALGVLVEIAGKATAIDAARVSAANSILDRAYGRPGQSVELTGTDQAALEINSNDGFAAFAAGLDALALAKSASFGDDFGDGKN